MPRSVDVTTWYLETSALSELRRARVPQMPHLLMRAERPLPVLNRFLYTAVGGDWHWRDRLVWTHARWMAWLDRPEVQTWVLYVQNTPAGYVELEKQPGDNVEIAYFGLMREFTGRGLGGYLLSAGIESAWAMAARRVWVHTCSLDHPAALANYQARGMRLYKTEVKTQQLPEKPDGPWLGAYE